MSPEPAAKIDYGLDAPGVLYTLLGVGLLLSACALAIFIAIRVSAPAVAIVLLRAGLAAGLYMLAAAGVMFWSSRVAKLRVRDRMLDALPWRGDERVLDVGCGRGLLLIGAAQRLRTGKAIGIDIWRSKDLSENREEATLENARVAGVSERIEIREADVRTMPFPDASFDTVLSCLTLHNIDRRGEREKALREMVRVLRPGGHLAIFDILHTQRYAKHLRENGMSDIHLSPLTLLWCMPSRWFTAVKAAASRPLH